jgi:hypothetical protein
VPPALLASDPFKGRRLAVNYYIASQPDLCQLTNIFNLFLSTNPRSTHPPTANLGLTDGDAVMTRRKGEITRAGLKRKSSHYDYAVTGIRRRTVTGVTLAMG